MKNIKNSKPYYQRTLTMQICSFENELSTIEDLLGEKNRQKRKTMEEQISNYQSVTY